VQEPAKRLPDQIDDARELAELFRVSAEDDPVAGENCPPKLLLHDEPIFQEVLSDSNVLAGVFEWDASTAFEILKSRERKDRRGFELLRRWPGGTTHLPSRSINVAFCNYTKVKPGKRVSKGGDTGEKVFDCP
jgi:hypothetical protein